MAPKPCQRRKIRVCGQLAALLATLVALRAVLVFLSISAGFFSWKKNQIQPSQGLARARETSQAASARAVTKISTTDARAVSWRYSEDAAHNPGRPIARRRSRITHYLPIKVFPRLPRS